MTIETPNSPPLVEYASVLVGSVLWGITCLQTFVFP